LLFIILGLISNSVLAENSNIKDLSLDELFSSAENDEIDGLINDAIHFRREFNLSSAIDSLKEVISKTPKYAEAWNQLAIANFYKDDYLSATT